MVKIIYRGCVLRIYYTYLYIYIQVYIESFLIFDFYCLTPYKGLEIRVCMAGDGSKSSS